MKIFLFLFLIMSAMSMSIIVVAETEFFVQKSDAYDLKFNCENAGALCSSATACNVTITDINSSVIVDNQATTNLNNGLFNITLTASQNNVSGEYNVRASCIDGGFNGTTLFVYEVNPTGIRPSDQRSSALTRGVWFFFIIALLLMIAFFLREFPPPVKWTIFVVSVVFFVLALNTIAIDMQDQVVNPRLDNFFDGMRIVSIWFYYFVAFLLGLIWILTLFNTWIFRKNQQNLERYGLA